MDPNVNNQGAVPPPEVAPEQLGQQTQYFPPQSEYNPQGPAPSAAQGAPTDPYAYTPPNTGAPVYPPAYHQGFAYPPHRQHVGPSDRDRTLLALILIGGGFLFLFEQMRVFVFRGFGDLVLLIIGGIFMYAYLNTRPGYRIGFLIPGAVMLGIGAGQVLRDMPIVHDLLGGDVTRLTLGLGFCLIWALERRHWWALIPGGILVASGLFGTIGNLWPLALIALGVYMFYDQSRRRPAR